jgi:cytochrome P450
VSHESECAARHSASAFEVLASPLPLVPIAFDPPEQTRYRRILQPFFSPRAIRPLEGELRRQIIEIIEPIAARGECDFVAEMAGIFPRAGIPHPVRVPA